MADFYLTKHTRPVSEIRAIRPDATAGGYGGIQSAVCAG